MGCLERALKQPLASAPALAALSSAQVSKSGVEIQWLLPAAVAAVGWLNLSVTVAGALSWEMVAEGSQPSC